MKKLSDFKENKVDLESVNGGRYGIPPTTSSWLLWHSPGGASTPGNTQAYTLDFNGVVISSR